MRLKLTKMFPFTCYLNVISLAMYAEKCIWPGTMGSELSGHPVVGDGINSLSTQCEKITSQDVCTEPCHIKKSNMQY